MSKKHSKFLLFLLILALLLPLAATASAASFANPSVPKAAKEIANGLDSQIEKFYLTEGFTKRQFTIIATVPVYLNDFDETSPLARQMSEEVSALLVEKGYSVSEMRKGNTLYIEPHKGEFILTREAKNLANSKANGMAILVGTYTITQDSVRFNMSLLHTPSNQILAKISATVPVSEELIPLLYDKDEVIKPLQPSVQTRLK